MAFLVLSRGYVATVDDDSPTLGKKWSALVHPNGKHVYGVRVVTKRIDGKRIQKMLYLHREVMDAPSGVEVDHINRNTLDNRKENLRFATRAQQNANRTKGKSKSGFKGVTVDPNGTVKFVARYGGKHIGRYASAEDAARAYDAFAKETVGDFATLNFPS